MNFSLSEEQQTLVKEVDEFCRELDVDGMKVALLERPGADSEALEEELERKLIEKGWYGLPFPSEYGGQDKGAFELGLLMQAFHRGGLPYPGRMSITVFNGLNVYHNGTEDQIKEIIPKIIRGERSISISVTEPNAGSDINAMKTKSVPDKGGFRIAGQKVYSSGAAAKRNIIVVATRSDSKKHVRDCMTLFLVPSSTKGLEFRRLESLGRRMGGLYEVFFDDVWVPEENVLGKVNQGWKALTKNFNVERAVASAAHLGFAERIFSGVLQILQTRMCNGRLLGRYQSVRQQLADYAMEIEAARLLVYRSFYTIDAGKAAIEEVSTSKLYCSELVKQIGDFAMEMAAGSGYLIKSLIQWYFRESRIATIGAGSSQMMRNTAGAMLGLKSRP